MTKWDELVALTIGGMLNADEDMSPDDPWGHNLARAYLAADKHDGDCTKQAHTCFLCEREHWVARANAALRALLAKGLAIVPGEATPAMLAAALPVTDAFRPSMESKRAAAAACLSLSDGNDVPNEGQAVEVAALLHRDYGLMVSAGSIKPEGE